MASQDSDGSELELAMKYSEVQRYSCKGIEVEKE